MIELGKKLPFTRSANTSAAEAEFYRREKIVEKNHGLSFR